jgi:hypothetical protein
MPSGLDVVLQRIERTHEQRRDLEREMRAWAESGAYEVWSQKDEKTGYTLYYLAELKEIPPRISFLIGETIHSLRASLDNLAYQLFLVCRTDPAEEGSRVEFPIYDDSKSTESQAFRPIKTFRKEIIEAIRKINPCKSGNSTLWTIHRLDIIDKHRRIITGNIVSHSVFVRDAMRQMLIERGFEDMVAAVELRSPFITSSKTRSKAQVGDIIFAAPPDTSEEMKQKLKFTFDVAFDEPGIIESKSVLESLDLMLKAVKDLASSFGPFLI